MMRLLYLFNVKSSVLDGVALKVVVIHMDRMDGLLLVIAAHHVCHVLINAHVLRITDTWQQSKPVWVMAEALSLLHTNYSVPARHPL
jgi:hypothetical protein